MNKRFVWTVGAIREQFPDIPLEATESTLLWDRQEGRAVVSVYSCYANAFCLEHKEHGQPFTDLEEWFNGLSNEALISEGIEPTKPAKPDVTEAANAFYDMVTEHLAKLDPRYQSTFIEQQIKVWNYFAQAIGSQNPPTIQPALGQQNATTGKLARKIFRQSQEKPILQEPGNLRCECGHDHFDTHGCDISADRKTATYMLTCDKCGKALDLIYEFREIRREAKPS